MRFRVTGIKRNILLKNHTTFRIGGPAQYFLKAETKEDLIRVIKMAKKSKVPFFILGGGSNLLVADRGYRGLVIKIQNSKFKIQNLKIITEAGIKLGQLVNTALETGLTGLEWAAGIPGTVGGAIRGNAGAFHSSIGDSVKSVEIYDIDQAKIINYKSKDCEFNYRESIFKENPNLIILGAELQLKEGSKPDIKRKMKEYLDYKKKTQPLNFPSAGSIFKNPLNFSAGELIEKCGLKGKKIGNVKISEIHANFIVNLGEGQAKDIIRLIQLIKIKVKNQFNIKLKEEIQYLGF